MAGEQPGMYPCHNDGGNQEFTLTKTDKHFKHNDLCLGIRREVKEGAPIVLGACTTHSTRWELHGVNIKVENHQMLCLHADPELGGGLKLAKCDHSPQQTFKFELKDIKA